MLARNKQQLEQKYEEVMYWLDTCSVDLSDEDETVMTQRLLAFLSMNFCDIFGEHGPFDEDDFFNIMRNELNFAGIQYLDCHLELIWEYIQEN